MLNILTIFKLFTNINHYCSWISGAVIIYVFYRFFFKRNSHHPPLLSQITSFGGLVLAFLVIWFLFFKSPHQVNLEHGKKSQQVLNEGIPKLEKERDELQQLKEKAEKMLQRQRNYLKGLLEAKEVNKRVRQVVEDRIKKIEDEEERITFDLDAKQKSYDEKEKELSALQTTLVEKKDAVDKKIAELQNPNHIPEYIDLLEAELKTASTELGNMEARKTKCEGEIIDLGKTITQHKTLLGLLNKQNKSENDFLDSLIEQNEELKQAKFDAEKAETAINTEIEELKTKISILDTNIEAYKKYRALLDERLAHWDKHNTENGWNCTNVFKGLGNLASEVCGGTVKTIGDIFVKREAIRTAGKAHEKGHAKSGNAALLLACIDLVSKDNPDIKNKEPEKITSKDLMLSKESYEQLTARINDDIDKAEKTKETHGKKIEKLNESLTDEEKIKRLNNFRTLVKQLHGENTIDINNLQKVILEDKSIDLANTEIRTCEEKQKKLQQEIKNLIDNLIPNKNKIYNLRAEEYNRAVDAYKKVRNNNDTQGIIQAENMIYEYADKVVNGEYESIYL